MKKMLLILSHLFTALVGFAIGIYLLPILTAPDAPSGDAIAKTSQVALYTGEFKRSLKDSDAFHWGEGTVYVGRNAISLKGQLAPGPDYRVYLSPQFVETEDGFNILKKDMLYVGDVKTFDNFIVPVPGGVNLDDYNAVIVWCEAFGQFISAASYKNQAGSN